jgi:hypothetical protein
MCQLAQEPPLSATDLKDCAAERKVKQPNYDVGVSLDGRLGGILRIEDR